MRMIRRMELKEGISALIGAALLGWLGCGLWAKNTLFWSVVAVVPGMLAVGSLCRGIWFVGKGLRNVADSRLPVLWPLVGAMAVLGGGSAALEWWGNPASVPVGVFKITDSRGFGAGMTGQFLRVQRSGRSVTMELAPERGRGEVVTMRPERIRRAVGMDCALVFAMGSGTAFCEYDRVLKIWRVEWSGLGEDRWLLMREI